MNLDVHESKKLRIYLESTPARSFTVDVISPPAHFPHPLFFTFLPCIVFGPRFGRGFLFRRIFRNCSQTHGDTTFIQMFWIFGQPAAVLAVGARHALSSVTLRPSFIHSDSVIQVSFLGCGHPPMFDFVLDQSQSLSLEIRLTYCVLGDEPRGKRTVPTDEVVIRPSIFGDDLA